MAMDELIGTVVGGKYRLERQLGAGGMGMVYAAIQIGLNRKCAVKLLHESLSKDGQLVARFKREAEVAASIGHPNIIQVTDFGMDEGRVFLVMDLLQGMPLADVMEQEVLSPERVRFIASQVLSALDAAHGRDIVHRDLKPDNIYLTSLSGVADVVKLLDFGIARMTSEQSQKMTTTGQVLGTPAYMSPEQARGQKVDQRTDLYSLGVVMYEALSGQMPVDGDNYHELMFNIVGKTPTPLSEHRPDLPKALVDIIAKAMAKSLDERYQTATEFRRELEALGPIAASSPAAVIPSTRHDGMTADTDAFAQTAAPGAGAVQAIDTQPDAVTAVATQAAVTAHATPSKMKPAALGVAVVLLLGGVAAGFWATTQPEPVALNAPPTESELAEGPSDQEVARELAKLMLEEQHRADSEMTEMTEVAQMTEVAEMSEVAQMTETSSMSEMSSMSAMSSMSEMSAMSAMSAHADPLDKPARLRRFPSEPHPPLPHRAGNRPWQDAYGNPIVWASCGNNYIKEVYPILPSTQLEFSSFGGNNVVALDQLRPFMRSRIPQITECFRGHTLNRGQRVVLSIDAEGNVTGVDLPRYCPIPSSVRSCVANAFSGQRVAPDRAAPGDVHGGLDVDGA